MRIFAKSFVFAWLLQPVIHAKRLVSKVASRSYSSALESSRHALSMIQEDLSQGDPENNMAEYLSQEVLKKCQEFYENEEATRSRFYFSYGEDTVKNEFKKSLEKSKLCEQRGEQVVQVLAQNMNNSVIANWICQGFEVTLTPSIDEESCKETGNLLLGGLQQIMEAKKDRLRKGVKLGLYLLKAALIVVPVPNPLAKIMDDATDLLLKKLTDDADEALDALREKLESLEGKMWDISRKVVAEEFLRVGGAQVEVAEDQVRDVDMINDDDLWHEDRLAKEGVTLRPEVKGLLNAAKRSARFNRWAAIEQNLAMTFAILRPPEFMETPQQMEPFIKVMIIHFEIEMALLSRMYQAMANTGRSFRKLVTRRAHRTALMVFPYLLLYRGRFHGHTSLLETLKSPLLRPNPVGAPGWDPCSGKEEEELLLCIWLRLLSRKDKAAKAFRAPWTSCQNQAVNGYSSRTKSFHFDGNGAVSEKGFRFFKSRKKGILNMHCARDQEHITEWQEFHSESSYQRSQGNDVAGRCVKPKKGSVLRHLKFTSVGSAFCTTLLTFKDISVGELVSVNFHLEADRPECNPRSSHTLKVESLTSRSIKNSTCYISTLYA